MAQDDPRARLHDLAAAAGTSLAALSRMLGRNAAYLQQYVRRGSPRTLPEVERRRLAAFFGVGEVELGGAPGEPPSFRIARLDVAASAGPGALVDGEVELGTDAIDAGLARRLGLRPGAAAIIRVRGDSMAPGLVDGDHLVVDTADRTPRARAAVFVIRIDEAVMVKRVVRTATGVAASSDNPAAPAVPAGPIAIVGRVVWQMRRPR